MEKFWLPFALVVIALLTSILGIIKDVLPPELFPRWLMYGMAGIAALGAVLQFFQGYQGLRAQSNVVEISAGIKPIADAPEKVLTSDEQRVYNDVEEAVERYRKAPVKLFFAPAIDAGTLYKLALIQFNQRKFAAAEENLKYALKLDSDHTDSYNLLLQLYQTEAMQLLQKQDYKEAEALLKNADRLLEKKPQGIDSKTVVLIGYVYKSLGQVYAKSNMDLARQYWTQAKQMFSTALVLNQEDPSALNGLGNILYFEEKYQEALEKHSKALMLAPNYTAAANDAALVCEALMCQSLNQEGGNAADQWRREAISFWEKAIQLSGSDPLFEPTYSTNIRYRVGRLREGQTSSICK
jgi:tetratricopeptide (TPR) repeat protein